jgi:hypothetical protein
MKCELDFEVGQDGCAVTWSQLPSDEQRAKIDRILLHGFKRIDHYAYIDPEVHSEEERELVKAMGNLTWFHVTFNDNAPTTTTEEQP